MITRWAVVDDALIATLRAWPGLAGAYISDGPQLGEEVPVDLVVVGHSGDGEEDVAGSLSSEYRTIGLNALRDERVEVRGMVQAIDGGTALSVPRARAIALLGEVETALRANPTLGLEGVARIEMSAGTVRQQQTPAGCGVRVEFTVTAVGLI